MEHIENAIQCELKLKLLATASLNKETSAEQDLDDPTPEDAEKAIQENVVCISHPA